MHKINGFRIIIMLISAFIINSCLPFVKINNQKANDFLLMGKNEYAKKYYTLYNEKEIDFSKIKENKAYYVTRSEDTMRIVVFCKDGYTYSSSLMPLFLISNKISQLKLYRSDYFFIDKNVLKLETLSVDGQSSIDEGIVVNDTIFMKKKYFSKKPKTIRIMKNKYILLPQIRVYKFGDDLFVIEQ